MDNRVNITRGYMKLRVWQEAKELYLLTCQVYLKLPYLLRRIVTNQVASVDSVHRNIAEGYGRKSHLEYLRFLDIALASLAESTSGNHVYQEAEQLTKAEFEQLDKLAYKLENGLRNLIISIRKKNKGDWNDSYVAEEFIESYGKLGNRNVANENHDEENNEELDRWKMWNDLS